MDYIHRTISSSGTSDLREKSKPHSATAYITSHIIWDDYNFPPCIKVLHFRLNDFKDAERAVVKKMYVSWILMMTVLSLSLLTNIVLGSTVLPSIIIIFAILNFIIIGVTGTFLFFWGYFGIAKRGHCRRLVYKVGEVILCILYFIFSIIPAGAFNGWVKIWYLVEIGTASADFGIFMCCVESLIYMFNCGFGLYCVHQVNTLKSPLYSTVY
jgi:hypothetical protein